MMGTEHFPRGSCPVASGLGPSEPMVCCGARGVAGRASQPLGMQGKGLGVQPRGASCTGGIRPVSAPIANLAVGKLPSGATAQASSEGTRWPRAVACATT